MRVDIFSGLGVEITLARPEDFLKIKETLTRIGVSSRDQKILYQTCHILHKQGRYAILHYKELFELDGEFVVFTEKDRRRRNLVAKLIADWNLASLVDPTQVENLLVDIKLLKIIPHKNKAQWNLVPMYEIGTKKT